MLSGLPPIALAGGSAFLLFAAAVPAHANDRVDFASPLTLATGASATAIIDATVVKDESQKPVAISKRPTIARISVSRAADSVGAPIYFRSSRSAGSVGMIVASPRKMPDGVVFSAALPSPPATSNLLANSSLTMPSLPPLNYRQMTSGFGNRLHPLWGTWRAHEGVDLAARLGTPIVATEDGIVNSAAWRGGYGLLVALDHHGGIQTRYGHMSRFNVSRGDQVHKGDIIGFVGSTGDSTGPHLHYEIRLNGIAINPASHLSGH